MKYLGEFSIRFLLSVFCLAILSLSSAHSQDAGFAFKNKQVSNPAVFEIPGYSNYSVSFSFGNSSSNEIEEEFSFLPVSSIYGDSLNCSKPFTIVILGSSTAVGTGASPIDSSWVNKLEDYVKSKHPLNRVINLAKGGYTTYQVLRPNGYRPPRNRPKPDRYRNISRALTYDPDLIIINLPSNDATAGYTLQEQKNNYEAAMDIANDHNIPVWVTTTQPRNNLSTSRMDNLIAMRDWTFTRFEEKAIDFWTTLANNNGTINSIYGSGDGIHLNKAGHLILFTRTIGERLLDSLCLLNNIVPVANAGNDIVINLPSNTIQLNGSLSNDSDGNIISYQWSVISGPQQFTLSDPTAISPLFSNLGAGIYEMELIVKDNLGAQDTDTQIIEVISTEPQPPVCNAGSDTTITLPLNSYQLDGLGSYDVDGSIISYTWNSISAPGQVFISGNGVPSPSLSNLLEGEYVFELMVVDDSGMTDKDTVSIVVNPVPNSLPIALAGDDNILQLPANTIQLDGSLSYDPDGTIVTFNWSVTSGPAQFIFDDIFSATPFISNLAEGTYTFLLTVTDDDGEASGDQVIVTVHPVPNVLPVAIAGTDQEITLPVNTVILNGSASYDADGFITDYSWNKITGPAGFSISGSNEPSADINNLSAGVYGFELVIKDNRDSLAKDTVYITVNKGPNSTPVADAGEDITITLPLNNCFLNGSSTTDSDNNIISYLWHQLSGPSNAVLPNSNSVSTIASGLTEGTYHFVLTVTDDSLAISHDTITVNVEPQPPVTEKYVKVNIYSGSNPADAEWNNWNVQSNLSLNTIKFSDGIISGFSATLSLSTSVADNGASYPVNMCPLNVGRTTSYSTVSRTLNINGLDNQKQYNLEFFSSRNNTGNSTRFTIDGNTITVLSSKNYNTPVSFSNIIPDGGQISIDISRVNTFNYINGFILTEINGAPAASRNADAIVENGSPIPARGLHIYPNPFNDDLLLEFVNEIRGKVTIELIDASGRLLRQLQLTKQATIFSYKLDMSALQKGIYFIRIGMEGRNEVVRGIKK